MNKNCIVFLGPSLTRSRAITLLNADYREPAKQGDVYAASLEQPWAIIVIDGYFESTPSVWHKEILWAISRGIHVYGAASMGAMRAAEMHEFGMIGVGAIFEYFRDEFISDDDEVAVSHYEDENYKSLSESMVNVRATLNNLLTHKLITIHTRDEVTRIAKELFYTDRTFDNILRHAEVSGISSFEIQQIASALPQYFINLKQADAIAVLELVAKCRDRKSTVTQKSFQFQHTEAWQEFLNEFSRNRTTEVHNEVSSYTNLKNEFNIEFNLLLNELRLCGIRTFHQIVSEVLSVAGVDMQQSYVEIIDHSDIQEASNQWRFDCNLLNLDQIVTWMKTQGLDHHSYSQLQARDAQSKLHNAFVINSEIYRDAIVDRVLLEKSCKHLISVCKSKALWLSSNSLSNDIVEKEQFTIIEEYFELRLSQSVPKNLHAYARLLGFNQASNFIDIVVEDFQYRSQQQYI